MDWDQRLQVIRKQLKSNEILLSMINSNIFHHKNIKKICEEK